MKRSSVLVSAAPLCLLLACGHTAAPPAEERATGALAPAAEQESANDQAGTPPEVGDAGPREGGVVSGSELMALAGGGAPGDNMGVVMVYGSLSKSVVTGVVRENVAQLRGCYERELITSPDLSGRVTFKWVIEGAGSVKKVMLVETDMNNAAVESCLHASIESWKFPPPKGGGIVIVTHPFVFTKPASDSEQP